MTDKVHLKGNLFITEMTGKYWDKHDRKSRLHIYFNDEYIVKDNPEFNVLAVIPFEWSEE